MKSIHAGIVILIAQLLQVAAITLPQYCSLANVVNYPVKSGVSVYDSCTSIVYCDILASYNNGLYDPYQDVARCQDVSSSMCELSAELQGNKNEAVARHLCQNYLNPTTNQLECTSSNAPSLVPICYMPNYG